MVLSGVANDLPAKLDHRIHFRVAGDSQDTVVRYPGTPVHKDVVRLRPPLRGDSWVVLEGAWRQQPSHCSHGRYG
jgi:hypothetical protein